MTDKMARIDKNLEKKLRGTLEAGSLRDLVNQRKKGLAKDRNSFLLLDTSGSMDGPVEVGSLTKKIDALGHIVKGLKDADLDLPAIEFGAKVGLRQANDPLYAAGGTPLAEAIEMATNVGADHIIIISDGEPDNEQNAINEALKFNNPIDVFYVGPEGGRGDAFLQKLTLLTGGTYEPTTLKDTKALESKIKGLLGA